MNTGRKASVRAKKRIARQSPLRAVRRQYKRGHCDGRHALTQAVGAERADAWIHAFSHARIGGGGVRGTPYQAPCGRMISRRHTARATFDLSRTREEKTARGEDDPTLRAMILTLLSVLDCLGHERKRVWDSDTWLGRDGVPHERAGGIASHAERCVRTIELYFGVFRSAGILQIWQPPVDEKTPARARTRKGRAYNCYELVGEMPRRLAELMRDHYAHKAEALAVIERQELTTDAPVVPPPARHERFGRAVHCDVRVRGPRARATLATVRRPRRAREPRSRVHRSVRRTRDRAICCMAVQCCAVVCARAEQ